MSRGWVWLVILAATSAFWLVVVLALATVVSSPRGGPESGAPSALPEASRPAATVIPAAHPSRVGGPEGTVRASGNLTRRTATPHPLEAVTREGIASWVGGYGRDYLALPWGRGIRATICGPGGCWTGISTDVGPDQRVHPDRVADLSPEVFELVCGVPRSYGLCPVTVTRGGSE